MPVMTQCAPQPCTALRMRSSSVATVMEAAPLAMATCHTHSISGLPSIGSSETGISSPSPSIIFAVTRRTNSGALGGTAGGRSQVLVTASGTVT